MQQEKEQLNPYQEAPYSRTDAQQRNPKLYGVVRTVCPSFFTRTIGFLYVFQTEALNKVFPREVGFPNIDFDNLLCGFSCHYSVNEHWIKCVFPVKKFGSNIYSVCIWVYVIFVLHGIRV